MVKNDTSFIDFDIYLVNYRTPFVGGAPNIYETAGNELAKLKSLKVFEQYQEIYFISHSMGGIVVKSILTRLNHPQDLERLRQIKGVVYLAVPAQGSDLARFVGRFSRNPQLKNIEPAHLNAYLQDLEDRWGQLMEERDNAQAAFPRVYCAYETRETDGMFVVPREFTSSRCDNRLHPLDFDHLRIAKPTAYNEDPYLWVMAQIRESGGGIAQDELAERTILIDCHLGMMPKLVPPEGRIYVLPFYYGSPEIWGGGLAEYFAQPGSEFTWPSSAPAYRCQLTNYGDATVFNVVLAFPVMFREIVRDSKNPNLMKTGAITGSGERSIEVTKIDVGTNGFVFYIYNQSQHFVSVFLPQSVTLQRNRDNKRRSVRLIQPPLSGLQMQLAPFPDGK